MSIVVENSTNISLTPNSTVPISDGHEVHHTEPVINYYAPFWSFIAGALTGSIEAIITYPIEYVKTHLQLQHLPHVSSNSPTTHAHNGIFDCVKRTVKQHSPLGLYRGFIPVLLGSMPKQASRWAAYEWATEIAKRLHVHKTDGFSKEEVVLSLPVLSVCGLFAGVVEAICAVGPTESVKTRIIYDFKQPTPKYQSIGTLCAVRSMLHEFGFRRTFYSGVSATMMKQGMNQALRFPAQKLVMDLFCSNAFIGMWHHGRGKNNNSNGEINEERMNELQQKRRRHPLWNGLSGFFAGVISVIVTQPVDVVKTQMQSGALHSSISNINNTSTSMPHVSCSTSMRGGVRLTGNKLPQGLGLLTCFRAVYRQRGVAGFYAGFIPRCVHVGAHVALTFTIFPVIRRVVVGGNTKPSK